MDWKSHWNTFPCDVPENDFLRQVGKTVGGQPISAEQLDTIVRSVIETLDVRPTDRVLDLCCGNGLIGGAVARCCERLSAVDYSEPLIRVARKYHAIANIEYVYGSVLRLEELPLRDERYDKIYMYEALQHFSETELPELLHQIEYRAASNVRILLGSIPDAARLENFYDTPQRQEERRRRIAAGTEAIGTWWRMEDLEQVCRATGFAMRVLRQPPQLHTHHYRVDVVAERGATCTSV